MHLQEIMAGAGRRQLEKVEADAAPAARWNGEGEKQSGGRQMIRFDALARRAGLDELGDGSRKARPPDRATRQGEGLVAAEVAP